MSDTFREHWLRSVASSLEQLQDWNKDSLQDQSMRMYARKQNKHPCKQCLPDL